MKYPAGLLEREKKKKFVWDDGEGHDSHDSQGCDSVVSDATGDVVGIGAVVVAILL